MAAIEYLVTGQGHIRTDAHKQSILLHESFVAKDSDDAYQQFNQKFDSEYNAIKIFSIIPLDKQEKFV